MCVGVSVGPFPTGRSEPQSCGFSQMGGEILTGWCPEPRQGRGRAPSSKVPRVVRGPSSRWAGKAGEPLKENRLPQLCAGPDPAQPCSFGHGRPPPPPGSLPRCPSSDLLASSLGDSLPSSLYHSAHPPARALTQTLSLMCLHLLPRSRALCTAGRWQGQPHC